MLSNYLAEIWGITMVVIALAFLLKENHLKRLFSAIETEQGLFLWGIVSFVVGLAMVLSHNVWIQGWQVIITIFGWLSMLKGLCLLFMPELNKKCAKKIENSPFLPYGLFAAVIIGLILTYLGFTA